MEATKWKEASYRFLVEALIDAGRTDLEEFVHIQGEYMLSNWI